MENVLKVITTLSPAPPLAAPRDFDGFQLRWKGLVFRPAMFKWEGVVLSVLGGYLLLHLLGKYINQTRVEKIVAPFRPFLSEQFRSTSKLQSSGSALHLLFGTGRRNVMSLHMTVILLPLHDIVSLVMHLGQSVIEPTFDGSEEMLFNLTLGKGDEGLQGEGLGVWAVVDKSAMRETKQKRWDLTFPRLQENASVPITHALFTEHSDCTDIVLKTPNVGVAELMANPTTAGILKYLLVTDVLPKRPTTGPVPNSRRTREIVLSVYCPRNEAQAQAVKAWLQVALNIADLLGRPGVLKPEVARKLASTRKSVDADLVISHKKDQDYDKPAEETADEKRAAKKRLERAGMSEKERLKADELDKKRDMRKMQKKQMAK